MPSFRRNRSVPWLLGLVLLAAARVDGQEATNTLSVFFIGNSYLCFNNLPGMVAGISGRTRDAAFLQALAWRVVSQEGSK